MWPGRNDRFGVPGPSRVRPGPLAYPQRTLHCGRPARPPSANPAPRRSSVCRRNRDRRRGPHRGSGGGRRDRAASGGAGRHEPAVFMPRRHVQHLPRPHQRGGGPDGPELRAGAVGD